MSDVPMPVDLSEEAVAEWLRERQASWPVEIYPGTDRVSGGYFHHEDVNVWLARAVRALVREKVREAVEDARAMSSHATVDYIVARVMREEAPRG